MTPELPEAVFSPNTMESLDVVGPESTGPFREWVVLNVKSLL